MYYLQPLSELDFAAAADVWESSVRATHDFLSESDIQRFRALLPDYFAKASLLVGLFSAAGDELLGFAGVNTEEQSLDMLFLRADCLGQGMGEALLRWAVRYGGAVHVDVNEQNPKALRFYERHGFTVQSRSERDGLGNPFPILHLTYQGDGWENE